MQQLASGKYLIQQMYVFAGEDLNLSDGALILSSEIMIDPDSEEEGLSLWLAVPLGSAAPNVSPQAPTVTVNTPAPIPVSLDDLEVVDLDEEDL